MDKYLDLARKIKQLVDKGIDGERTNAEAMLNELMKKHGFTIEEIEGEKISDHFFDVPLSRKKIWIQIVSSILGKTELWGVKGKKTVFVVKCTTAEQIEIEAKFEFYANAYEKEVETFYSAFIQVNKLYAKKTGEDKDKEYSKEELEKMRKIMRLAKNMDEHQFLKQLS